MTKKPTRKVTPQPNPAPYLRVGDWVNYHAVIGGPITTTGHKIRAIEVLGGRTVAWITGKAGCVAIEALSRY